MATTTVDDSGTETLFSDESPTIDDLSSPTICSDSETPAPSKGVDFQFRKAHLAPPNIQPFSGVLEKVNQQVRVVLVCFVFVSPCRTPMPICNLLQIYKLTQILDSGFFFLLPIRKYKFRSGPQRKYEYFVTQP